MQGQGRIALARILMEYKSINAEAAETAAEYVETIEDQLDRAIDLIRQIQQHQTGGE